MWTDPITGNLVPGATVNFYAANPFKGFEYDYFKVKKNGKWLEEMKLVVIPLWAMGIIASLPVSIIEAHVNLIIPHVATSSCALLVLERLSTAVLVQHDAAPVITAFYENQTNPFDGDARLAKRMLDDIRAHLAGES